MKTQLVHPPVTLRGARPFLMVLVDLVVVGLGVKVIFRFKFHNSLSSDIAGCTSTGSARYDENVTFPPSSSSACWFRSRRLRSPKTFMPLSRSNPHCIAIAFFCHYTVTIIWYKEFMIQGFVINTLFLPHSLVLWINWLSCLIQRTFQVSSKSFEC